MRRALVLALLVASGHVARADDTRAANTLACRPGSGPMARVDLYFGARRNRDRDWPRFLAEVVTPRFPDGLTSLDGYGQWRGIAREAAHVLIIFYRPDAANDARIEAIRSLYKRRFKQKSVLRADTSACVAF